MNDRYRLKPCPPCAPFYVATRTYTARCSAPKVGPSITITRQFKSTISEEHAEVEAMRLAKEEAEALLQCRFEATQCWLSECAIYIGTVLSNGGANLAYYVDDPIVFASVGDVIEINGEKRAVIQQSIGDGVELLVVDSPLIGPILGGEGISYYKRICRMGASMFSQSHAQDVAVRAAKQMAEAWCDAYA